MSDFVKSVTGHKMRPVPKCFIVLGMHRSATSLVAQGLSQVGVNMGDVSRFHWEDQQFMRLNDKILKAAGGSWCCPPPEDEIINAGLQYRMEILAIVRQTQQKAISNKTYLWGWKDPRNCLTAKLYLPLVENLHFVYIQREVLDVAQSLARRNKFTLNRGIKLAREYNRRALELLSWWDGVSYGKAKCMKPEVVE